MGKEGMSRLETGRLRTVHYFIGLIWRVVGYAPLNVTGHKLPMACRGDLTSCVMLGVCVGGLPLRPNMMTVKVQRKEQRRPRQMKHDVLATEQMGSEVNNIKCQSQPAAGRQRS